MSCRNARKRRPISSPSSGLRPLGPNEAYQGLAEPNLISLTWLYRRDRGLKALELETAVTLTREGSLAPSAVKIQPLSTLCRDLPRERLGNERVEIRTLRDLRYGRCGNAAKPPLVWDSALCTVSEPGSREIGARLKRPPLFQLGYRGRETGSRSRAQITDSDDSGDSSEKAQQDVDLVARSWTFPLGSLEMSEIRNSAQRRRKPNGSAGHRIDSGPLAAFLLLS